MQCHICGSNLIPIVTDLPFKVSERTILIIEELPVLQCEGCREFLIEDQIMERVETVIAEMATSSKLVVIPFAA